MRRTIGIASSILNRSRDLARREHVTLRALVEEGLELVLAERQTRRKAPIKPVTFRGRGLSPQFQRASWARIRDASYERCGA